MMLSVMMTIAPVAFLLLGVCSRAAKITISPDKCMSTLQRKVNITCENEPNEDSSGGVTLIELARNGEDPMVFLQDCSNVTYVEDWSRRLKAGGIIRKNGGRTHLDVTLNDPTSQDTGIYTCTLLSVDTHGRPTQSSASANLVVESLEVNTLESVLVTISTKLSAMEDRIERLQHNMDKKIEAIEKTVNKTANYRSAFSAVLPSQVGPVKVGQVIPFPTIKTLDGVGYNATTGVFTAPIRGLYVFHLGFHTWESSYNGAFLSITKNGETLTTALGFGSGRDHSSCSTVTVLEPGDTVNVKCTYREGSSTYIYYVYDSTVFTGYLIQVL